MRKGILASAGAVALAISTIVGGTYAANATTSDTPVDLCTEAAISQQLESWACLGGLLAYPDPDSADGSDQEIVTERVAPETAPAEDASGEVRLLADDYDTWCELGTICTRSISSYISETKGNAAYGDQNGVIGSFDIVIRTNLNGRQARWNTYWIHDSGPSLGFSNASISCNEDGNIWGCGVHAADNGDGAFSVGTGRYNSPTVYGNYLSNSNDYWADVTANFLPSGYWLFSIAPLATDTFYCPSSGNCYF